MKRMFWTKNGFMEGLYFADIYKKNNCKRFIFTKDSKYYDIEEDKFYDNVEDARNSVKDININFIDAVL